MSKLQISKPGDVLIESLPPGKSTGHGRLKQHHLAAARGTHCLIHCASNPQHIHQCRLGLPLSQKPTLTPDCCDYHLSRNSSHVQQESQPTAL